MLQRKMLYLIAALVALNAALALNWSRTSASETTIACTDPPCTCGSDAGGGVFCTNYLYDQCSSTSDCEDGGGRKGG